MLSKEYYKLSKEDRLLHLSGVPLPYLKTKIDVKEFNFQDINIKLDKIITLGADRQKEFMKQVMINADALGSTGLYVIASHPIEKPAYRLAALFCKEFFNLRYSSSGFFPEVKWIDLGRPDWQFLKSSDVPEVAVIHGFHEESDVKRIELGRDFVHRCNDSTVIVVANVSNALEFVVNRLGSYPDAAWQLGKKTLKRGVPVL